MRYTKAHKQATHARLVKAASEQFRAHGSEGISIAALMDQLKLTHGGFYRHFASKDELYAEALTFSFEQKAASLLAAQNEERLPKLQAVIDRYLSLDHCRNPAEGCPVAALATEIARQPPGIRQTFDDSLRAYMQQLATLLPGATAAERERNALALFSGMAGALTVARAVADEALQAQVLAAARELYTKVYCA